jgi:TonB family protein
LYLPGCFPKGKHSRKSGSKNMGKIVKYCSSCDEGFGERFSFCPDCGGPLQAFAMNPVEAAEEPVETVERSAEPVPELVETEAAAPYVEERFQEPEMLAVAEEAEEPVVEEEVVPPTQASIPVSAPIFTAPEVHADEPRSYAGAGSLSHAGDENFHVTMVEETNGKQRNVLLLGATALVLFVAVGAWGVSLFQKDINVGAIGDDQSLARLVDDVPAVVEEEPEPKKEKDDAGGGGGGGREEEREVNQGDLANQSPNPTRPPDAHVPRADFELKMPPPQTQGNKQFEQKYNTWGDPNSLSTIASNGMGSGGGMGSGRGTGQGSGNGTGAGSGSGSGYGSGNGNGNGNGTGDGDASDGGPPPVVPKVSTPIKILAKPKALFTDAARTNQTQGTVRLKVVLLANGSVGSITPLNRLGDGLTEQAIAAARQIRFEPAKVNGVAVSKTMTVEYNFSLY